MKFIVSLSMQKIYCEDEAFLWEDPKVILHKLYVDCYFVNEASLFNYYNPWISPRTKTEIKKRVKVTFQKEYFCRMTQEKRKRSKRKTVSFLEAFDINPAESPAYFP